MSELPNVALFFLIFGIALVLYGALMAKTGDMGLMPYRAVHSIRSSEDVRHVGRIVAVIGLIIGGISLVLRLVST